MVHGYAMLVIEKQIPSNDDGSLIFDIEELIPSFGYRADASDTKPEPL
tara:strand:- start:245 stop:388 length:144 start_codon:yes stop_codon:yes gene_type:complete